MSIPMVISGGKGVNPVPRTLTIRPLRDADSHQKGKVLVNSKAWQLIGELARMARRCNG